MRMCCVIQLGSFSVGVQRYSLMTIDAMRASLYDEKSQHQRFTLPDNATLINMTDTMHIIAPVRRDQFDLPFDLGTLFNIAVLSTRTSH